MLTLSLIKNSGGAARYYTKEDNYYLAEADARETSLWWGSGASELGISGKVEEKELQRLLEGKLPNGITIGLQKDGAIKHRPGYDICFHAPKSVSILALDGEDKRFYNAHLDAIKETLKIIERDCAQSKVFKDGKARFENTKNLTVALVRHTTSRELDLHLHHHALVMNATKRPDDGWRALASSMKKHEGQVNGFFERVHNNQIYYGLIYKAALAKKVKSLGCELEIVGKHGLWEIKGVPKEARDVMSKRRLQIEERIDKLNYPSLKAADVAALDTREKKSKNIKLSEIKQTWRSELASVGFSSKEFIAQLDKNRDERILYEKDAKIGENILVLESNTDVNRSSKEFREIKEEKEAAREAVKNAVEHLSQYKLKLDYAKIAAQALEFLIGRSAHSDIVIALNDFIKDGSLIPLDKTGSIFITKELIETEKAIMDIVGRSKDSVIGIDLKSKQGEVIDNTIDREVIDCAVNVLQSNNRLSLIESRMSDTDSITFIDTVFKLAESSGKTVRILSPNRMMTNDINENIKRKPNNLWQWLVSLGKPEIGESVAGFKHKYKEEVDLPLLRFRQGKDVIIVNNAETLGCNDMHSLLELTEKSKAKVIFLRDINVKQGLNAGNSIETTKQAGIETFDLKTFEKKPSLIPELKAIQDNSERTKQLAYNYALKEDKERNNTRVFVGSKDQLKSTNEAIREELKNQGKLPRLEHSIQVLTPIYMSRPEVTLAHKYPKNAVIRFYDTGLVHRDWNVEGINREKNTLRLIQDGKRMLWNPKKQETQEKQKKQEKQQTNYAVFKKETLKIAIGDKLIATSNMNDLGIKNATRFVVQNIDRKHVWLASGTKVHKIGLDNLKNSHFHYDYATTISKSSEKQIDHILADVRAYALDKSVVNELTGRAKESLTIFTNDVDIAQKNFKHIPIKLTATEALLDINDPLKTNGVDRFINNKTIEEIKGDIGKAIDFLRTQHNLAEKVERRAVDFAIEKITSHNAGFTHKDLVKEALTYALHEAAVSDNAISHIDIMKVIAEKRATGELVMGKYFDDGTRWTTKEILELEKTIIGEIKKGEDKLKPLLDQTIAKNLLENTNLTQDQKNACHLITTTKDQFVIIQGYAGTGKTTMFAQVQNMLQGKKEEQVVSKNQDIKTAEETQKTVENNSGINEKKAEETKEVKELFEVLALAPTHRAVKELKNIGIKAQTLKSFLVEQQKEQKKQKEQKEIINMDINTSTAKDSDTTGLGNKLIILDEASMVSNKDFVQFLEIVSKSKGHVVFSGDIAQHIAIEFGKPFEIVQRSNILKIVYLREIVRQKNPNLKEAVENIIHKNYAAAFKGIENENPQEYIERLPLDKINSSTSSLTKQSDKQEGISSDFFSALKSSIVEVDNNKLKEGEKTLEQMVAEDFLSRTPETRDQTVVIVHSNHDRRVITDFIRRGLKEQGEISKEGIKVNCLTAKGLTDAEHKFLGSYNVGDVVKFGKKYYYVVKNEESSKSLLLRDESGKTRYFYPEKYVDKYNVELYENINAELAIGDTIRLTKTDKERELYANFEYKVKKISDGKVFFEGKSGDIKSNQQKSEIILDPKELRDAHWDYAQTVTGYGIQGGSKAYAIDFEVSYRKNLANQRSFYIGVSRAIKYLIIYTDNKARLLNRILHNKGDKYAALEVVGDIAVSNNNISRYGYNSDRVVKYKEGRERVENEPHQDFYDVKEVKRLLSNSAESFVERLLGRPNEKLSSVSEWRYGNKGSLAISMSGDKRGFWRNFETGEYGDLLTLIQKEIGLSFRESLKYVSSMIGDGLYINTSKKQPGDRNLANSSNRAYSKYNKEDKTSKYARQLASESQPIVGTIVEKYLKEIRGIVNVDSSDIRYHPKVYTGKNEEQKYMPAMLSLGRDKNGNIQCVQATYLDSKTVDKANLTVKKRTYALSFGALVSLQSQDGKNKINNNEPSEISFVAEGVETGLSIKDAIGTRKNNDVVVTLGKSNFANIEIQNLGKKVILCLDNDGVKSFADNVIHKTVQRLIDHSKEVFISIPNQIKNTKTDFNDIARIEGIDAVKKHIDNAIPYERFSKEFKIESKSINNDLVDKQAKNSHDFTKQVSSIYEKNRSNKEIGINNTDKFFRNVESSQFTKELEHSQNKKMSLDLEINTI